MPTQPTAIRSRPEPTQPHSQAPGPLPVLTRIPWVTGDSAPTPVATPATSSSSPTLTHFEYLMGEFGLDCTPAAPEYVSSQIPGTDAAGLLERRSEPIAPPVNVPPPRKGQLQRRNVDWTEIVLRLDAAIEPYTRAIVLLVLMAVAAFTVLLLKSSDEETPIQSEPTLAQTERNRAPSTAARPQPKAPPDRAPKPSGMTATTKPTTPTAQGPAGIRPVDVPPVATLSSDIRTAPPEAIADPSTYPSTSLPGQSMAKLPSSEPVTDAPREARQSDASEPIHPYK